MLNLKKIREDNKISQQKLANNIGVSRSTIAMWETGGSQPDNESLIKLSKYFMVSIDELLSNVSEVTKSQGIKIPVLGKVQAGLPIEAVEYIIDFEEITTEMASTGEYFGLMVKGNSMEPRFVEGDVVIVKKQSSAETGDIVIALVNGDEATIKKIKFLKDGIMLIPFNTSYDAMFYSNEDIENKPVTILGKVVELRGKF